MDYIKIVHGAGARESWEIIEKLIVSKVPYSLRKAMDGYGIDVLDDGAVLKLEENKYLVVSVDSFTVNPIFFPGGDIGHLAISGTINDLVVMGAKPIAFMDTIVVEEGFPYSDLEKIVDSIMNIIIEENISLIGGDFKVMPRGTLDKILITGVGFGISKKPIVDKNIKEGDKIIVTGPIAEHGAAILAAQLGLLDNVKGIRSDSRPLTKTVYPVIEKYIEHIHAARDPTRGGLSSTLNEWVLGTEYMIVIDRSRIPVREEVREFLDAMGVDPLSMACEGIAVLAVDPLVADDVVKELRARGEKYAEIIGEVKKPSNNIMRGRVIAVTEIGGKVVIEPKSINLPRIC
ncbi:MAG: hydrogenase expression/formation protein HypE [Thermoprotei archaeon]|nr:MAG: hydrogenase expression/formation protein HypE [Thermoprotei archaeon]